MDTKKPFFVHLESVSSDHSHWHWLPVKGFNAVLPRQSSNDFIWPGFFKVINDIKFLFWFNCSKVMGSLKFGVNHNKSKSKTCQPSAFMLLREIVYGFLLFQLMLECWMVVINLFHFHIPLVMDHIGILGIGLELMTLCCKLVPVQYLEYKCGLFTYTRVMKKVFWKISRGNKEKCLLFSLPSTLTASEDYSCWLHDNK